MTIKEIKKQYEQRDNSMYGERNVQESLAILYHENSKFTEYTIRDQGSKIANFNNSYIIERATQPFKCYPNNRKTIELSDYIKFEKEANLLRLLRQRRSTREFDETYKISLFEIANLLYQSYGVTHKAKVEGYGVDGHFGLRNVPSGGGLYSLEVYIVIFNSHLDSGLYHYRPDSNALELLKSGAFSEDLNKIIQTVPFISMKSSSCLIITTGIIERLVIKYGDRGYRFLLQESGIVAQTISLLAEALDLGSCMLGGYNDDKVNEFLGVDGVFEAINNVIIVGKKNTKPKGT